MSVWLGKPKVAREDIEESLPSIPKYFPKLTEYMVNNPRMRLMLVLPNETAEQLTAAVEKKYGHFSPGNLRKAAMEAVELWLKANS